MKIVEVKNETDITLIVSGRVDSVSYMDLQNSILAAFQKTNNLYLDMADVSYISSAGIRAMLVGSRTAAAKGGVFKCCKVVPEVYNVINMMGYAELLLEK